MRCGTSQPHGSRVLVCFRPVGNGPAVGCSLDSHRRAAQAVLNEGAVSSKWLTPPAARSLAFELARTTEQMHVLSCCYGAPCPAQNAATCANSVQSDMLGYQSSACLPWPC